MSRVLMVDNPALFRMLDASFVRRAGWEILAGRRPDDIVGKARAHAPTLVLLDTTTADFDVPACVGALKADAVLALIPILVLADAGSARPCEEAGADATLAHPVPPAALEAALCALGRVRSRAGRRRPTRLRTTVGTSLGALRGRLKDISRSGAFLALPRPLPLDSRVEIALRLRLHEGLRDVRASGVVVRQVQDEPGSHLIAGVGIRFTGVDATSESIIDRFVNLEVEPEAESPDAGDEEIA